MKQKILYILPVVGLVTLTSCSDKKTTESTSNETSSNEQSSSGKSSTKKTTGNSQATPSQWNKITAETLDKILLEQQVKDLFKIEGEIKKKVSVSKVYGKTITYSWEGQRHYVVNGKKVSKKQRSALTVSLRKNYGSSDPERVKTNFNHAYKPSSAEQIKNTIESKRKRDTPTEVDLLMEGGLTAEENKRMMEIMKERAAAGATGLKEPNRMIKPTYEKIDANTVWEISNESLFVLSGAKILEMRCSVSQDNEVSKKLATQALSIIQKNLDKLP